jgi:hypothetical protein
VSLDRFNAIVSEHLGLHTRAEHKRDVGAINVSIEQTNFVPQFGQGERQIHGQGSLSHSSLAGTYSDNRFDARKRLRPLGRLTGTRRHRSIQDITFQMDAGMENYL